MLFKALILLALAIPQAYGQGALSYSGRLVNANGSPVTGTVNLEFHLAYSSDTTVQLCTLTKSGVSLSQGVFHAKLDFGPASCLGSKTLVQVLNEKPAPDSLFIRVRDLTNNKTYGYQTVNSMPYAVIADQARSVGPMGASAAGQVLRWDGTQWVADTIDEVAAGAIGTPELADNSVTSAKIQDLTITGADVAEASLPQSKITGLAASFTGKENALGTATSSEYLAGDRAWRNFQNDVRATFVGMGYVPILAGGSILSTDTLVSAIAKLDGRISNAETAQGDYVSLAGDAMSGPLILNADPSVALGAATKQYVDAQITAVSAGSSQWSNIAGGINYAAGNVGIGTATPAAKLDVNGGIYGGSLSAVGNSPIYAPNGGVGIIGYPSTAIGVIQSFADAGGTPRALALNPNGGNLGVGTNAPTATLHVNGTVRITGGAPADGKVLTSDATGTATWENLPVAGITSLTGDVTGTGPGATAVTIAPGAVTYAKTNFANGEIPKEKINNLVTDLAGKEPVLAAGTSAQYYRGDKTWQPLNTTAVPEGTNLYFTEPRVLGTTLSGFSANTSQVDVTSSDSALVAFQKLQSSINAILTGSVAFENNVNLGGFRATNVGAPSDPTDAATKAYVDSLASAGASKWTNVTGGINYGSGNVGVGMVAPEATVHVRSSQPNSAPNPYRAGMIVEAEGTSIGGRIAVQSYSDTEASFVHLYRARGTKAAPQPLQNNDLIGAFSSLGFDGTTWLTGPHMRITATEPWTATAHGSDLRFFTVSNGTTPTAERMRITHDGNVGIGTTTPATALHVAPATGIVVSKFVAPGSATLVDIGKNAANQISSLRFLDSGSNGWSMGNDGTDGNKFKLTRRLDTTLGGASMVVDTTGNVGFGTLDPTTRVQVAGSLTLGNGNETCSGGNFAGAIRYTGTSVEFCNGAAWTALASAGGSTPGDNTVTSAKIADGSIVDADVAAGAAIAQTKIANLSTDLAAKQPLDADLTALAGVATNGVLVRTGAGTAVTRSLAGTANRVSVTNADGVAGNPTVDVSVTLLPSPLAGDLGRVLRATGANTAQWQALASGDITAALGFTPINKAGDTMPSGVFDFTTSSVVRVLNPVGVTDVANKQYVDGQISGAANQWTQASGNVYRATGNVGIGTASPIDKLEVDLTDLTEQTSLFIADPAVGSNAVNSPISKIANRWYATETANISFWRKGASNDGGAISFRTTPSTAAPVDRLFIDSNGNVGVGSTSPGVKLSVGGSLFSSAGNKLHIVNSGSFSPVSFGEDSNNYGEMHWNDLGNHINFFTRSAGISYDNNLVLKNGNVGIGTALPAAQLHIGKQEAAAGTSGSIDRMVVQPYGHTGGPWKFTARDVGADSFLDIRYGAGTILSFEDNGRVGIGTSSPAEKFHVLGDIELEGDVYGGIYGATRGIWRFDRTNSNFGIFYTEGTPDKLQFATQGGGTTSPDMTLAGGNVGIGTTTPESQLHLASIAPYVTFQETDTAQKYYTGVDGSGWWIRQGSTANPDLLTLRNTGNLGLGTTSPRERLDIAGNGKMIFGPNSGWGANLVVGGNGWAGPDASVATTNGNLHLDAAAGAFGTYVNWYAGNQGLRVGNATGGGYGPVLASAFTVSSDRRLKKDVKVLEDNMSRISQISGVSYKYSDKKFTQKPQIGVIAQDVQKVYPEAVLEDEKGILSVNYAVLVAPLIEAVKEFYREWQNDKVELKRDIASVDERVQRLEAENQALKAQNEAIKAHLCAKDPKASLCN